MHVARMSNKRMAYHVAWASWCGVGLSCMHVSYISIKRRQKSCGSCSAKTLPIFACVCVRVWCSCSAFTCVHCQEDQELDGHYRFQQLVSEPVKRWWHDIQKKMGDDATTSASSSCVRESSLMWLMLTRTNYSEWVMLMQVNFKTMEI
jgi:hypothetical protein